MALCLQEISFTLNTDGKKRLPRTAKDGKLHCVRTLTYLPIPAWPECCECDVLLRRFSDPEFKGMYAEGIGEDDFDAMEAYEEEQERKKTNTRNYPMIIKLGRFYTGPSSDPKPCANFLLL